MRTITILNTGKWGVFVKINKTDKVVQIYNNIGVNRANSNNNKLGKDQIKLSERAIDYQFAISKLKELPEMRMEKVDKIKKEIKSGNYNVESKKIVEKIYQNIDLDNKI